MGDGTVGTAPEAVRVRALAPGELAWVALLPCALAGLIAILALGPPLGHLLFPAPGANGLWPPGWEESQGHPEPVKQARYLLAVLAPLLLAGLVLRGTRRAPALRPATIRIATWTGQALAGAFVALALLGQYDALPGQRHLPHLFGPATLAAAAALVLIALAAPRRDAVVQRLRRLARETPARRAAGVSIAALVAALWLIEGVTTERLVEDVGSMDWTLDDAYAVLNGSTPLVDFHLLYAKLLPYPAALVLTAFGRTTFVYTLFMALLGVLALLAVYAVFRRLAGGRSLPALGLFVPFVALSDVGHTMTLNAMWPMRYGGAYLMAWLTVRHVEARAPRRAWVLFLVGGLVAINDLEFGIAALAGSVVALLAARPPASLRAAAPLARDLAAGLLGAVALVTLPTLARAGAPPSPSVLLEWPRIFSRLGWFSLPMPLASLHLAIYATFVAALVVAAVRVARGAAGTLLTAVLAWSGVFGLLAGSYYVGRSDDVKLASMLSAWAFALVPLTLVAGRALAARGWRRPAPAEALVLLGFALAVCSIAHVPSPPQQIRRLTQWVPAPVYHPAAVRFVRAHTHRGERVVILLPMSFRIAEELGLRNVAPYGTEEALVTRWQLEYVIDAAHRAHAHKIFLKEGRISPAQIEAFALAGFRARAEQHGAKAPVGFIGFLELSDA
jgi:hypothetical protein